MAAMTAAPLFNKTLYKFHTSLSNVKPHKSISSQITFIAFKLLNGLYLNEFIWKLDFSLVSANLLEKIANQI